MFMVARGARLAWRILLSPACGRTYLPTLADSHREEHGQLFDVLSTGVIGTVFIVGDIGMIGRIDYFKVDVCNVIVRR